MAFCFRLAAVVAGLCLGAWSPALAQTAEKPSEARCRAVALALDWQERLGKATIAVDRDHMASPPSAADKAKLDALQAEVDTIGSVLDGLWPVYVEEPADEDEDEDETDWAEDQDNAVLIATGRACLQ